ncbi:zinc ribbon domain-containing protein [Rhodococcus globerulus]|uniref:Zinc ribbon domain-containing protein n=1 Tax=Rhodococcus globerulus TaxID=33008 RepID=A0ABU4C5K3_RHOGO|nr:zinc ribbon domain-containing protein [Rhodococcus globerulus]MDV6271795.1 zinc ribbon domain-containing protein [Rhodococcus globerulus]
MGAVPNLPGLGRYLRSGVGSDRTDERPVDGESDDTAAASQPSVHHGTGGRYRSGSGGFRCQGCGFEPHADINAAINIRDRGFNLEHQPEGISGDRVRQSRKRAAPTVSVA